MINVSKQEKNTVSLAILTVPIRQSLRPIPARVLNLANRFIQYIIVESRVGTQQQSHNSAEYN